MFPFRYTGRVKERRLLRLHENTRVIMIPSGTMEAVLLGFAGQYCGKILYKAKIIHHKLAEQLSVYCNIVKYYNIVK